MSNTAFYLQSDKGNITSIRALYNILKQNGIITCAYTTLNRWGKDWSMKLSLFVKICNFFRIPPSSYRFIILHKSSKVKQISKESWSDVLLNKFDGKFGNLDKITVAEFWIKIKNIATKEILYNYFIFFNPLVIKYKNLLTTNGYTGYFQGIKQTQNNIIDAYNMHSLLSSDDDDNYSSRKDFMTNNMLNKKQKEEEKKAKHRMSSNKWRNSKMSKCKECNACNDDNDISNPTKAEQDTSEVKIE